MAYFDSKQLIADTLGQLQQKSRMGHFPTEITPTTIGDENSIPVINISPSKSSFIGDEFPYNIKAITLPGFRGGSEEDKEETSSDSKESSETQQNSISSFNWLIPLLGAGGLAALFAR